MINAVTCWRASCDSCSMVKDFAGEGDALFCSVDEATKALRDEDWEVTDSDRVLCPRCVCQRDGHPMVRYGFCVVCDAAVPDPPKPS